MKRQRSRSSGYTVSRLRSKRIEELERDELYENKT